MRKANKYQILSGGTARDKRWFPWNRKTDGAANLKKLAKNAHLSEYSIVCSGLKGPARIEVSFGYLTRTQSELPDNQQSYGSLMEGRVTAD